LEKLLAPSTVGLLIQAISAIIVAVITSIVGPIIIRLLQRDKSPPLPRRGRQLPSQLQPISLVYAVVGGIAGAITFVVIGWLIPRPSVELLSPTPSQQIETRLDPKGGQSVSFSVTGNSSRVGSNPQLRIYVLVHSVEPPDSNWWIQSPAVINPNGNWTVTAWYGSSSSPPQLGNKFAILAVASPPISLTLPPNVSDPSEIHPEARSNIVQVSIGSIR
jgi:hypothetical protein